MTRKPIFLKWEKIFQIAFPTNTIVWISNSAVKLFPEITSQYEVTFNPPEKEYDYAIIIGGGSLIDKAKIWKLKNFPNTKLIIIPTLWGSGSEINNIAVEFKNGLKSPILSNDIIPNFIAIAPDIHLTIPDSLAKWGYGDTYSHAIEAFLSPLTTDSLREEIADFLNNKLLNTSFEKSSKWFELSQTASYYQANSGVGLIHGIAHELEVLTQDQSHAKLCSTYLLPVLKYNLSKSTKASELFHKHHVPLEAMLEKSQELFLSDNFSTLLPLLNEYWGKIIRNPLSRINSTTVTQGSIEWFNNFGKL